MRLKDIQNIVPILIKKDGEFRSLNYIDHALTPGLLVYIDNKNLFWKLSNNTNISCVVTTQELTPLLPPSYGIAIAEHPKRTFCELHNYLVKNTNFYWTDFQSRISEDSMIHPTAYIADKNVQIGRRTVIEPNVTVLERVIIGDDVVLRAGCTVGTEGFDFKNINGEAFNMTHGGGVKLHDRVEIQANCAISRSTFGGYTEIGEDTHLDNLVHIAHNVKIGKRCALAASVMVAGGTIIGDDVRIGPGTSVSSGIHLGDQVSITIGSVVVKNVESGKTVTGNFAIDHSKFLKFYQFLISGKYR
ncbi:UDP-3-O-(3-hydroxymyristoyl)glucosamine N-acyltransferase [Deltaproteobacteria bacterium TL4]